MDPSQRGRRRPQQFNFITFDHPSAGSNAVVRKEIRSHVTARQHRIVRERQERGTGAEKEGEPSGSRTRHHGATEAEGADIEHGTSVLAFDGEEMSNNTSTGPLEVGTNLTSKVSADMQNNALQRSPGLLSVETILRAAPLASQTSRISILNDPADSMASMLGRLRLNFPMVMDHYHWIVATQAKDFEKHFMTDLEPGSGARTLIPAISKDPALVAVAVLIAAGHMLAIRNAPMSQNTARCIYELRHFVIEHINSAIQDPERAISDSLLVAILILATHEGFQGSVKNYHVHMKGLTQMINMRGGLHKLDESQAYLKKYIIWQDTNVATIMRCKPYHLQATNSAAAPTVTPNPRLWLLMDSKPP